ncbi:MAG: hypothetical protein IJC92_05100 [Bacteroidaceae bacterium]|nr:hypothetical protein [Bacteroidaceae bacterium]
MLIFSTLNESDGSDAMTEVDNYVVPLLTELNAYIYMNDTLFNRIRTIYDAREGLALDEEQNIVLCNYYNAFVRGGALLGSEDRRRNKLHSFGELKFPSSQAVLWFRTARIKNKQAYFVLRSACTIFATYYEK